MPRIGAALLRTHVNMASIRAIFTVVSSNAKGIAWMFLAGEIAP